MPKSPSHEPPPRAWPYQLIISFTRQAAGEPPTMAGRRAQGRVTVMKKGDESEGGVGGATGTTRLVDRMMADDGAQALRREG